MFYLLLIYSVTTAYLPVISWVFKVECLEEKNLKKWYIYSIECRVYRQEKLHNPTFPQEIMSERIYRIKKYIIYFIYNYILPQYPLEKRQFWRKHFFDFELRILNLVLNRHFFSRGSVGCGKYKILWNDMF